MGGHLVLYALKPPPLAPLVVQIIKATRRTTVTAVFYIYRCLNSKSFESFSSLKMELEAGQRTDGALSDPRVRKYLMRSIVPKIEFFSGR